MAGNPANALSIIGAFEAGQGQGDRRIRRNALANYASATTPEMQQNALNPIVAMGDFETVGNATAYGEGRRLDATRRQVAPVAGAGRFGEAARIAAGAGQVDLAAQMLQLDRAALEGTKVRGERAAATIFAALQLPADQRAGYFQQHADLATELGIPTEQLASFDFSDDTRLRAVGSRFLDASRLAGDVSLQKFGDAVQTIRTDMTGSTVLDSREIPVTRAEELDRRQVEFREQTDHRDFGYRQQRDQADDQYREKALDVRSAINSTGDVLGPVMAKVVAYGEDSLTEGERLIFDRYQQGGQQPSGFGMAPPPPPADAAPRPAAPAPAAPTRQAPAPAPAPAAASGNGRSAASPVAVRSAEDFERLPVGAWFRNPADGQVMQKAN